MRPGNANATAARLRCFSSPELYRAEFDALRRELKASRKLKLLEFKLRPPASPEVLREATRLAGGKLPRGMDAFYREMNGLVVRWEITDKTLRLGGSDLDKGIINVLPLCGAAESVLADWKDWVWTDDSPVALRKVKPLDFFRESAASLYPLPGAAKLGYHVIVTSSVYPIECDFEQYIMLALASRGLQGWRHTLCVDLHDSEDANHFRQVMPQLFSNYDDKLFAVRTRKKRILYVS